jgi:hypothetical protein
MEKIASFECSLPDIMSAISISGAKNGIRLKIDVPEIYLSEVMKMVLLRGQSFKVDVYDDEK